MAGIGGLLGLGGGAGGTGFSGPSNSAILNPTTVDQANTAYQNAQQGLTTQQQFVNATQAQNGLGNQSSVYNQLQGVTNGTGPNPAQAQLAQATGTNVSNQAALMAGQRGSNANAGLIARQAAMQGANTQQQAAGQAASLQAQQSLNALSAQGNLATQQAGQQAAATNAYSQSAQNEQQNLLNGIASQNNANVGMQSNINQVNGQLANTTMQNQAGLIGGLGNAAGGVSKLVGGLFADGGKVPRQMYANQGNVTPLSQAGHYAPIDPNAPDVFDNSQTNAGGPVTIQAPDAAVPMQQVAQAKANPASAPQPSRNAQPAAPGQPVAQASSPDFGNAGANSLYKGLSSFGSFLSNRASQGSDEMSPEQEKAKDQLGTADESGVMQGKDSSFNKVQQLDASNNDAMNTYADGGKVPAMVSPGERYLPPKEVQAVKAGKNPMHAGEKIPGEAKVKGAKDSYANDVVPKTLEAGGLVLPRSVTQSKNPEWAAHAFVRAHMAKGGFIPPKPKGKK